MFFFFPRNKSYLGGISLNYSIIANSNLIHNFFFVENKTEFSFGSFVQSVVCEKWSRGRKRMHLFQCFGLSVCRRHFKPKAMFLLDVSLRKLNFLFFSSSFISQTLIKFQLQWLSVRHQFYEILIHPKGTDYADTPMAFNLKNSSHFSFLLSRTFRTTIYKWIVPMFMMRVRDFA